MLKNMLKKIIFFVLDVFIGIIKLLEPKAKIDIKEAKDKIVNVYKKKELKKEEYEYLNDKVDLSIIVPVYNGEKYIDKCISSLINQKTKYKLEIIAVDDGSKDKTLEKLNNYKNDIVIITKNNSGAADSRNYGIRKSSGRYIGFVDIDDYVDENYAEKLLDKAYSKDADMAKCNYYLYDDNGIINTTDKKDFYTDNKYADEVLNTEGFIWNGIYKRKIWKNILLPCNYYYEDMILKIVIINKINSFAQVSDKLYYYRKNLKSTSRDKKNYKNYKCIDQLFLPSELIKTYNVDINKYNFNNLLFEYGPMLFFRTRYISKEIKKAIFIVACEYINTFKIDVTTSDYKKLLYSFKNKKFVLWKLISVKMYLNK